MRFIIAHLLLAFDDLLHHLGKGPWWLCDYAEGLLNPTWNEPL